jgi:hypothetical protein
MEGGKKEYGGQIEGNGERIEELWKDDGGRIEEDE